MEAFAIAVVAATAVADNLEAVADVADSLEVVVVFADLADSPVAANTLVVGNTLVGNIVEHSHNQVPAAAQDIAGFGIEASDFVALDIAGPEIAAE